MGAIVILPTYNEVENVELLSGEILRQHPALHVVVVDDASPDGTGGLVADASASEPRLHLIPRQERLGLGSAYLAGFRYALGEGYDGILTMDCDWSHHPRHLSRILAAMSRHDAVIGSRYTSGGRIADWPWRRRALSAFANRYTRTLLRLPVRDSTSGYRAYRRRVLEAIDPFSIRSSGYSFLVEVLHRIVRAGFSVGEIPIVFRDRRAGSSKIGRLEIFRAALHVARLAAPGGFRS